MSYIAWRWDAESFFSVFEGNRYVQREEGNNPPSKEAGLESERLAQTETGKPLSRGETCNMAGLYMALPVQQVRARP